MIDEYFYIYPLEEIQKKFPDLEPESAMMFIECDIRCGWNPDMANAAGKIYKIRGYENDGRNINLEGNLWSWDRRLGRKLEISDKLSTGYYYLDKTEKNDYVISPNISPLTVGTIVSMPYKKRPTAIRKIVAKLREKRSHAQKI